jgi:hypothetical protein
MEDFLPLWLVREDHQNCGLVTSVDSTLIEELEGVRSMVVLETQRIASSIGA